MKGQKSKSVAAMKTRPPKTFTHSQLLQSGCEEEVTEEEPVALQSGSEQGWGCRG